ncbi:MAG: aminotransferase class I/II-fold pyridoxal phosphate-dependent enzyme [Thermofilum sp.]|jgi:aspartate/methionine/tyrosine aminotransferase|nr:aminotransferase class I/II-fold pyridoxal phosphate-dependent enzyme [Thermofilum sp.]
MSKIRVSERIRKLDYPIRKYNALARSLEERGEKVIYLNIGDPLRYDFQPPCELVDEACRALREGHHYYSSSEGVKELREAIAYKEKTWNYVDLDPGNILVTSGVSEGINALYASLINEGDEVLIPDPSYPLYINFADFYGAKKVFYRTVEEEGWTPDVEDMRRKITSKTKFIVVNNPHNPTGAVYSPKVLREILDLAAEHNLPVVSDEIYDGLVYGSVFRSTASLAKSDDVVIGMNGFSKTCLATGWRLGYIYFKGPEEEISRIRDALLGFLMTRLSAVTPLQVAIARAVYRVGDHLRELVRKLDERRRYCVKRLREIPGFSLPVEPRGAFYAFPRVNVGMSDEEFARRLLLEEKVFLVYGSGFGPLGANHVRLVFLPPIDVLEEAFTRIEKFVRKISG